MSERNDLSNKSRERFHVVGVSFTDDPSVKLESVDALRLVLGVCRDGRVVPQQKPRVKPRECPYHPLF